MMDKLLFMTGNPVGVEEYGYVAADPLDPNIIYGGKNYEIRQTHRTNSKYCTGGNTKRQVQFIPNCSRVILTH